MTRAAPNTGRRRWMLPVLLGTGLIAAVGGAALGVFAYVNAATVYTDGDTIRIPVGAARPGEILWQEPASLAEPMLSPGDDYEPRVAWDGLTVYFSRGRAGRNADLYVAQRTPDGWTEPQPLAELNTPADELGPCPSYDGQTLYFYSDRAGGLGGYDLWLTHRGPSGWLPAIPAGPQVNSPFNEYGPSVSPDGRTLYFASNRPPSVETPATPRDAWPATLREDLLRRTYDLYEAAVTPGGFGEARPLAALNTPANEGAPCASPVGDFLYFASDRPDGIGGFDLYRARILRRQIHPPDSLGPQINTAANELDPALAQLGFALYFSSDRAAELDGVEVSLAAGTGVTSTTRRYHLYYAQAREVFRETGPRNAVDWAAVWQRLWPYLLWLLVALLALLLLWKLIGDMRDKRLSLLARCLMASMMAHALLLFLFSFWRVSAVLVDALRAGNPIRVGLVSTAAEPLAEQVAGSWAAVAVPQPRLPPIARAGLVEEPHSAPLPAPPRTERALSLEAPPRDPVPAAADAPLVLDAPEIPALAVAPALEPPSSLRPVVALPAADRPATAEPPPPQDPVPQPATIGRAAPTLAPSPTQDDTIDLDLPPADIHAPEFGGVTLRAAAAARDAALPSDRTTAVPVAALAPLPPAGPTSEPLALPAEERVVSSGAAERAGEPLGPQPGETDPPDAPRYAGPTGAAKLATLDPAPPTPAAPLAATSAPAWTPIAVADARVSSAPAPQVPVPLPALGPTSRPVDLALPEVEESAVFADSRQRPERAADAEYSLSADVSGGPKTDDRTAIRRPALAIRGSVRDARSGKPLPGATVQLDAGGAAPFELESDDRGRFALALEDVPDSFVVSAMSRGYVPQSTGLTAGQLSGRNVAIEFSLTPSSQDVVVVEPAPELHHLGNDRFEGRINSRFEKRAEGRSIRFTFRIADDALAGARRTARLTALIRGVQCEHPVRINGELLPSGLAESPADGSFGPAKIEFDAGLLRAGENTIEVRSRSCWGDIDDFEFVNMQIRLGP